MATVTLSRPDVTAEEVADALRQRLDPRYQVRMDGGTEADRLTVGTGSARVFRARVTISHQGDQTVLHVHSGGLTLPLQLINRVLIVVKVVRVLRAAPALRRGIRGRRDGRPIAGNDVIGGAVTLSTREETGPALSVVDLSKQFGERVAFDDVTFEIGRGEVFGFLGPNGAGKTTTVRTLATLIQPTAGSATVAGIPLTPENGVEIRRRIAVMPESPGLYLRLSVEENLTCFARLYELAQPAERIEQALRDVNLLERRRDPCGSLSKGLRQRVSLARALLSEPEIVFLDEPTSGLDPVAARDVHELIDGLRRRGVTIFLTTHRLDEAEQLCDRIAILNTTLRSIGRPDELRNQLFARTLTVRTVAPIGKPTCVFDGLPGVESWREEDSTTYVLGVSDATVAAPATVRALVEAGADVLSVGESRHSLQDVYLTLVDEDVEAQQR